MGIDQPIKIIDSTGHRIYIASCCDQCLHIHASLIHKLFDCGDGSSPTPSPCFICGNHTSNNITGLYQEWIHLDKFIRQIRQQEHQYRIKMQETHDQYESILRIIEELNIHNQHHKIAYIAKCVEEIRDFYNPILYDWFKTRKIFHELIRKVEKIDLTKIQSIIIILYDISNICTRNCVLNLKNGEFRVDHVHYNIDYQSKTILGHGILNFVKNFDVLINETNAKIIINLEKAEDIIDIQLMS